MPNSNHRFLMTALAVLMAVASPSFASSHSEAPGSALVRDLDLTDVYVFRSPDAPDTVTMIMNTYPFQEPGGGPNFYRFSDEGLYEIHIDNDGDARENITYQFRFRTEGPRTPNSWLYGTGPITTLDDPDYNRPQFYSVARIEGPRREGTPVVLASDLPVPPNNVGPKTTPDYASLSKAAIRSLGNGVTVFAGQVDDPFFVDLGGVFDLATLRPLANLHTVPPIASGAETPYDYVKGFNVNAIAIQVPIASLVRGTSRIIGVWATTSAPRVVISTPGRRQSTAGFTQVSRLGTPLVNEVVLPIALKDAFNGLEPAQDAGLYGSNALLKSAIDDPELAIRYEQLYRIPKAPTPRADIFAAALTGLEGLNKPPTVVPAEMLRINLDIPLTASPNSLGALAADNQGFPNGRRLTDDVTDILLKVFAGVLVPGFNKEPYSLLTDGIGENDKPFRSTFPYLAIAHEGKASRPHP